MAALRRRRFEELTHHECRKPAARIECDLRTGRLRLGQPVAGEQRRQPADEQIECHEPEKRADPKQHGRQCAAGGKDREEAAGLRTLNTGSRMRRRGRVCYACESRRLLRRAQQHGYQQQGRDTADEENQSPMGRGIQHAEQRCDCSAERHAAVNERDVGTAPVRGAALIDQRQEIRERAPQSQAGEQADPREGVDVPGRRGQDGEAAEQDDRYDQQTLAA